MALSLSGCTSLGDYLQNGFKVGPNYCRPAAATAEHWIDADDKNVREEPADLSQWWTVFNDPVLDCLIAEAFRQNLSLKEAGFRILEARAQRNIAVGNLFPQQQAATGSYTRSEVSLNPPLSGPTAGARAFDRWAYGFNLNWELDFWGRFRRAVAAAEDQLDASVEDYDFVLVTLLGDVAASYVQIRTDQQRIKLLEANVKLQEQVLRVLQRQFEIGSKHVTTIDVAQGTSILRQTQAQIPQVEIDLRQANNRLSILLGIPPVELSKRLELWAADDQQKEAKLQETRAMLDEMLKTFDPANRQRRQKAKDLWKTIGTIYLPTVPPEVVVGVPADLIRRRPDVRQAERLAAAQAEQIGIAQADLYPAFTVNGNFGYQAQRFGYLFNSDAFTGAVGPAFQWNILNYGRLANSVRFQDARFQELVVTYQDTVLRANAEVEDGLVTFLRAQEQALLLGESVEAGVEALLAVRRVMEEGGVVGFAFDFNQYAVIVQDLVRQEDTWAQAQGQIAQGLIQVYRALGGGWQIRCQPGSTGSGAPGTSPNSAQIPEEVPPPHPEAGEAPGEPAESAPDIPEATKDSPAPDVPQRLPEPPATEPIPAQPDPPAAKEAGTRASRIRMSLRTAEAPRS